MGTTIFSKSFKCAEPGHNSDFKISEKENLFMYKKVKIDEPMNSNYCSPKLIASEIWKTLLPTVGQTIGLNSQT